MPSNDGAVSGATNGGQDDGNVMASATGLPSGLWMQRLCFDESGPLVCPVVSGAEVPLVSLFLGSGRAQW